MLNVPRKASGYGMGGSSARVGENQVYLDKKLEARGNRSLTDRVGCAQRRVTPGYFQYQSPSSSVSLKNKTDRKKYKEKDGVGIGKVF